MEKQTSGRTRTRLWALVLALGAAAACNPAADEADTGVQKKDAATPATDQGTGSPDAAGQPKADAGSGTDAAGTPDARPGDAAATDTGPTVDAALGDAAVLAPPAENEAPPLFGPDRPGATPHDPAIAGLVSSWHELPLDDAGAQAHAAKMRDAAAALRAGGEAAADRIADVCAGVPVKAVGDTLVCLRLLSLVDSPRSLDLLVERARTVVPPWPEGAHPVDPAPEDLARQAALDALARRSREGTRAAADLLVRVVVSSEGPTRAAAVAAVFDALPRVQAKRRLKTALPADQMYLLYQTR